VRLAFAFALAVFAVSAVTLALACTGPGTRDAPGAPPTASTTPPADATAGHAVRYLALGDSFTIGTGSGPTSALPARLSERWRRAGCTVELENVAVNGYTTDDLIDEELPAIARFKPTFVTVAVGANDIVRGRTEAAYRANVKRIFAAVVAGAGTARIVALPQPDWSKSPAASGFGTPEAIATSIKTFNAALAAEAQAARVTFIDLYPLMERQADQKMLASDGLHPSAGAHDAWADALAAALPAPCP